MNQETKKKEYTKPEMEVVAFTQRCCVLGESQCEVPGECINGETL